MPVTISDKAAASASPTPQRSTLWVIKTLAPYLWEFRGRIAIVFVLLALAKGAAVSVPLIFKQMVDQLDVREPILAVPMALLLAYGLVRMGSALFQELRQIVFARVMARASRLVTLKVFRHLHALSLRFHLERRTGGVSRDLERGSSAVVDLLDWTIYTILPTLLEITLVCSILIWKYDWTFTAITLSTIAAYVIYTFRVTEWRLSFYRAANEADTRAQARAVDSLINYETVKYFSNEAHEASHYDHNLKQVEEAQVKSLKSLAVLNVGQNAMISLGVSLLMWRAAEGLVAGEMTLGDLVLVNAFLMMLAQPLNFLGVVYRETKQALTNIERMFALLDQEQEVQDRPGAQPLKTAQAAVEFAHVGFSYQPERTILRDVSFTIEAGTTLAVVGHSGSGKSTLARLLYRFYDIDEGAIRINGADIRDIEQDSLRALIGIVPQDTVLFNDTIYYNILYGRPGASEEEVHAAARAAQIHDFIESLPDGYQSQVGERGLKLSGGEKQRVAIARAILKNPPILIFDEATSALDSKTEQLIQAELERIAIGRTTLQIAHRLSTVMRADRIMVLDHGQVLESGTHNELIAANGAYAAMWARQAQIAQEPVVTDASPPL
jgi:ATP-binding cassette, subfamily B, heavy metal transporter